MLKLNHEEYDMLYRFLGKFVLLCALQTLYHIIVAIKLGKKFSYYVSKCIITIVAI